MSALTLKLLGPFEARNADGRRVNFATTKAQALLAYLLVEETQRPGAGRSRGELMTLLWPDTLPESAQTNLRQTLYRLRQSLPDVNTPSGEIEPFLMSDRQSVWLNPAARYRLDVADFEEALREAGRQSGEGQSGEGQSELLTRAASLYRGDFLEDVYVPDSEPFENWAGQVRESARRRVLAAMEQIAGQALAASDDERAMEYARRQIAIDNLGETAYEQLMRALLRTGRRSEALAEYAKLEQLLDAELGVEPSSEIAALAGAIRRGEGDPGSTRQREALPQQSAAERQAELILLDKVNRFWIEGVLDQSLHGAALIELGKEATPAALAYPWDMVVQRPDQSTRPLPAGLPIARLFDESGSSLLILGEPGAGKTTMLLELARAKIKEARAHPEAPLPVVFNLTSWSERRLPIAEWLVEELNLKYLIPVNVGRAWVEAGRLLLLLDGLDEARPEAQAGCVAAINAFRQERGLVQIAVCSRAQEYEALPERLRLNEAVKLLPLDDRQARAFLRESGASLEAVASLLDRHSELGELAKSPLMLGVIALTYGDAGAEDLSHLESAANRREHLFATYVERMFGRRGRRDEYSPAQTRNYLAWLAQSLTHHGQSVFLLEQLQPDWLSKALNRWLYALSTRTVVSLLLAVGFLLGGTPLALGEAGLPFPAVAASLLTSLLMGGLLGLAAGLRFRRQISAGREAVSRSSLWLTLARVFAVGVLAYLVTVFVFQGFGYSFDRASGVAYGNALVFALVFGLRGRDRSVRSDIRPVETIRWSWEGVLRGSIPGLVVGVVLGLLDQYVTGDTGQNEVILIFAALGALMTGLVGGLRRGVVASKARPNEGLRLSLSYGLRVGLTFALAAAVVFGLLFSLGMNASVDFWLRFQFALRLGLTLGLMALLWYGGIEVLHHVVLRALLRREGGIPARYARFLDHAVDLIFLRRVGGGYIFVHQLLQEYFGGGR